MGFSKQEREWISLSIVSSKLLRETPKQTVFWAKLLKSGLQFTIGLCASKPWLFPTYDPLDFSISLFLLWQDWITDTNMALYELLGTWGVVSVGYNNSLDLGSHFNSFSGQKDIVRIML